MTPRPDQDCPPDRPKPPAAPPALVAGIHARPPEAGIVPASPPWRGSAGIRPAANGAGRMPRTAAQYADRAALDLDADGASGQLADDQAGGRRPADADGPRVLAAWTACGVSSALPGREAVAGILARPPDAGILPAGRPWHGSAGIRPAASGAPARSDLATTYADGDGPARDTDVAGRRHGADDPGGQKTR